MNLWMRIASFLFNVIRLLQALCYNNLYVLIQGKSNHLFSLKTQIFRRQHRTKCDAGNASWRKRANRLTESIYNFLQCGENLIVKPNFTKFLPNLLNRIHLRRIWWYVEQNDIVGYLQRARFMPGSSIAAKHDHVIRKLY